MKFEKISNFNDLYDFENFENFKNFEKIINLMKSLGSYDKFQEFMIVITILKSIPTMKQLCTNIDFFATLNLNGYFNLIDKEQKYNLFVNACLHDSVDIAMEIYETNVDIEKEKIKEFMQNYLVMIGSTTEYVIFRKIWEKNHIQFSPEEIDNLFISILKTSNIDFIKWFYSLGLINIKNEKMIKQIGFRILANALNSNDFIVAIFICNIYMSIQ